jgi:integrase
VPDWVKKIPRNKPAFKRSPQELLTREEIQRLINAAEDPRHQLLVRLLAESGLRRGEVIGLRVGDVAFEGQLTKLWADGKSGQGEVYLYEVTPYLMNYLRIHPGRNNPDAPLFYEFGPGGQLKPWGLTTPYAIVRRLADKAGLLELDEKGARKNGKRVFPERGRGVESRRGVLARRENTQPHAGAGLETSARAPPRPRLGGREVLPVVAAV